MYKIITNFKSIVSMTFAVFLLNNANSQIITTIAGTGTGAFSGDGGPSTSAQLFIPYGVASDAAGNLYIADGFNQRIRKINAATGIISTIAGTGTAGYSGDGIAATSAKLNYPNAVCVDGSGNIYVSDVNNSRIRKINASTGLISTIAGIGSSGFSGDGGPATSAAVANTWAVAVDASGNVYVADNGNSRIRKITASSGFISTIAGGGSSLLDGVPATTAEIGPTGVAVDASGNVYISETGTNTIRKVDASTGLISTVAGNGTAGYSGDGSVATSAQLNFPWGIMIDPAGDLYISDVGNQRIRRVTASSGEINTIAGSGVNGFAGDGGLATSAQINNPNGLCLDPAGNLFFADENNYRVRKVALVTGIGKIDNTVDITTGINLFPNPSGNNLTIDLTEIKDEITPSSLVVITDVSGRTVSSEKISSQIQLKINTSAYSNGIYFVNVKNDKRIITKDKFIVSH
jgi:trimeric autotransporter adhesin